MHMVIMIVKNITPEAARSARALHLRKSLQFNEVTAHMPTIYWNRWYIRLHGLRHPVAMGGLQRACHA